MSEGPIHQDTLDELRRDMEERAQEKVPTVELVEGEVMPGLTVLKVLEEMEESGELQGHFEDLREGLTRDVAHIYAARAGAIPIYVDDEERFVLFSELEGPSPRNREVLSLHLAWLKYMVGRSMDNVARMKFTLDVTQDLNALETTEGKGAA